MSIKDQFITWLLKRKHKQLTRTIQFVNLNQAKTAGIIWKADDIKAFKQLNGQLEDIGILVNSLCFSNQGGSADGEAIFSPDDFSMFGKIKNPGIAKFINQKFDLLLDISLSSAIELQYLRSLSNAQFKAGWTEVHPNYFDLSIDVSSRKEPAYLAEQLVYYLSELNKQSLVKQKV